MGQIAWLPGVRPHVANAVPVRDVLVVGVATQLARTYLPTKLIRTGKGVGLRYLPAWELRAAGRSADLIVEEAKPSSSSHRVIACTTSLQLIEQDSAGWMWIDGAMLSFGPLVSFGSAESASDQRLQLGERAGWLLGDCADESFGLLVLASDPLLWIYEDPHGFGRGGIFDGWLTAARNLRRSQTRSDDVDVQAPVGAIDGRTSRSTGCSPTEEDGEA